MGRLGLRRGRRGAHWAWGLEEMQRTGSSSEAAWRRGTEEAWRRGGLAGEEQARAASSTGKGARQRPELEQAEESRRRARPGRGGRAEREGRPGREREAAWRESRREKELDMEELGEGRD